MRTRLGRALGAPSAPRPAGEEQHAEALDRQPTARSYVRPALDGAMGDLDRIDAAGGHELGQLDQRATWYPDARAPRGTSMQWWLNIAIVLS
jgi:hypothetical protein